VVDLVATIAKTAWGWAEVGLRHLGHRTRAMGCNSVDGTYIKHGPNINLRRMSHFLRVLEATPTLPFQRFETPSHPNHRRTA
jgi:hypothetical protein